METLNPNLKDMQINMLSLNLLFIYKEFIELILKCHGLITCIKHLYVDFYIWSLKEKKKKRCSIIGSLLLHDAFSIPLQGIDAVHHKKLGRNLKPNYSGP